MSRIFARYINLPERTDRNAVMQTFQRHTKLELQRFNAIRLPSKAEAIQHVSNRARADMLGRMRMHHESLNTVGAASCYLSHLTVLKEFLSSDSEIALVLEDDLQEQDAVRLDALVAEFTESSAWDIALLGWGRRMQTFPDGRAKLFPTSPMIVYGSHAYMVTRKAAEILLKHGYPMEMQWDAALQAIADRQGLRVIPTKQPHLIQRPNVQSDVYSWCPYCESHYIFIYLAIALVLGFVIRSFLSLSLD